MKKKKKQIENNLYKMYSTFCPRFCTVELMSNYFENFNWLFNLK